MPTPARHPTRHRCALKVPYRSRKPRQRGSARSAARALPRGPARAVPRGRRRAVESRGGNAYHFESTVRGFGCDNPTDPQDLTGVMEARLGERRAAMTSSATRSSLAGSERVTLAAMSALPLPALFRSATSHSCHPSTLPAVGPGEGF